jgi:hypothetical protein
VLSGGISLAAVIVPVDLDAVEERITPQLSLRSLAAALLAATIAITAFRLLVAWPLAERALVASLGAAVAWTLPTARVMGAAPIAWLVRLTAYALGAKRLLPEARAWQGVVA